MFLHHDIPPEPSFYFGSDNLSSLSVPGIQNKQAMPMLKGSAAAEKSERRDDTEEIKLFGTQNLQL